MRIVGNSQRAHHEEARHAERVPGQVAREAVVRAREMRRRRSLLFDGVEDAALLRIVRGDLQYVSATHPADRDVITEKRYSRAGSYGR